MPRRTWPGAALPDPPTLALIADHDADHRGEYADLLRRQGWKVSDAEDGRDALAKALLRRPDLILTDTRLPGISGYDLCRLLREDETTRDVPIVFVTSGLQDDEVTRARIVGADAVLERAGLTGRLAEEIERILARSVELRTGATPVRARIDRELADRTEAADTSLTTSKRVMLNRVHHRHQTTAPPAPAPALTCPLCDRPLTYVRSHIGGVSVRYQEQWDYYECSGGCGSFQYRQRTRKLRRV